MPKKIDFLFLSKSSGGANSTIFPMSKTITRSESMMVLRRWAIVRIVHSLNSVRIVRWIKSSVSKSTAAVASSKINTFVLRNKARARQTSCRCPTDRFSPPSLISWLSPAASPVDRIYYIRTRVKVATVPILQKNIFTWPVNCAKCTLSKLRSWFLGQKTTQNVHYLHKIHKNTRVHCAFFCAIVLLH